MLDRRSAVALMILSLSACDEAETEATGSDTSETQSTEADADSGEETSAGEESAAGDERSTSASDGGDGDDETSGPSGDSDEDSGSSAEASGDEASDESGDESEDEASSDASTGDEASDDGTSDDGTSEDETSGDDTSGGDDAGEGAEVRGVVTRSADVDAMNDGVGTLYLSLMSECSADAAPVYNAVLPAADLGQAAAEVEFSITGVAAGRYQLTGFLDDNDNASDTNPGPDRGDLVAAEGIGPACAEVVVEADDVDGVTLDLNFVMPFRR